MKNQRLIMNETTISKKEIKQLFQFMNRIKAYEKTFKIQKDSMTRLIWGLFLFGAGVLDYVISEIVYKTDSFGIFTLVPWLLAVFSGLIMQIFSDRHMVNIYSWEKPKKEGNSDLLFLVLGFGLIGVTVSYFNMTSLHYLTFPAIILISGFMVFVTDRKYYETNKGVLNQRVFFITPIICVLGAIIMIILLFINESSFVFHSMIFGTTFGGSFCITAYWNRKNIDDYFEKIDQESNSENINTND